MIQEMINRFSRWYNDLHGERQVYFFLGFCIVFLGLLWLSIRLIRFDAKIYTISTPQHIGKPSGPAYTDSLNDKTH
ncbi:hypothetical protein LT679_00595 [Mucilaginibacter roseus]|uniref:Nitrogen regulatory IIA protein n=1 Tax=Mucilaginibacter roseus TaxID=1528868 RepID=A0ABS8TW26_9SPHI|nr:hypothetical protein [Mucilaginibacter roseus]MCD8739084.1 hypothetical protein [Mucilaginibacter roseus]